MKKISQGGWFQTPFCFFKKVLYRIKPSGQNLSFNILVDPDLDIRLKQIYNISDNPDIFSI